MDANSHSDKEPFDICVLPAPKAKAKVDRLAENTRHLRKFGTPGNAIFEQAKLRAAILVRNSARSQLTISYPTLHFDRLFSVGLIIDGSSNIFSCKSRRVLA